jgi:hypothetical protein
MIPLMILALLPAGLRSIRKSVRIPVLSAFFLVCAFTAAQIFLGVHQFTSDTRVSAEKWIAENLRSGGKVEMYAHEFYLNPTIAVLKHLR